MSAEVETMMSASREVPWHGLGTILNDAPTAAEAIVAAGLDWDVELRDAFTRDGKGKMIETPGKAVVRVTDDRVLSVVGSRYRPIQNSTTFEFAEVLLDTGDVTFETAGSLRDGAQIWALAKIDRPIKVADDEVVPYMLLINGHDGYTPFQAMTTPVRVVCANTLQMALRNHKSRWTVRHSGDPKQKVDDARLTLNIAFDYYDAFEEEVAALIDTSVTDKKFGNIVKTLIPAGTTDRSEVMRADQRIEITKLYETSPTAAAFKGTGWGVLNAVSEWELWGRPRSKNVAKSQALKIVANEATPLTNKAHQLVVARSKR